MPGSEEGHLIFLWVFSIFGACVGVLILLSPTTGALQQAAAAGMACAYTIIIPDGILRPIQVMADSPSAARKMELLERIAANPTSRSAPPSQHSYGPPPLLVD